MMDSRQLSYIDQFYATIGRIVTSYDAIERALLLIVSSLDTDISTFGQTRGLDRKLKAIGTMISELPQDDQRVEWKALSRRISAAAELRHQVAHAAVVHYIAESPYLRMRKEGIARELSQSDLEVAQTQMAELFRDLSMWIATLRPVCPGG